MPTQRQAPEATNWDRYYQSVPATAQLTRKYTTSVLLDLIQTYSKPASSELSIVEIGGANSCFLTPILNTVKPGSYEIVDTNRYGLSLLADFAKRNSVVRLREQSVLDLHLETPADVVFSVGLVEHFSPELTRTAVLAHFDALRPNGIAIITFPTPTWLYRAARGGIEMLGMWKFPDERPLQSQEVISTMKERGEILTHRTMWPLILTQHVVVARKRA